MLGSATTSRTGAIICLALALAGITLGGILLGSGEPALGGAVCSFGAVLAAVSAAIWPRKITDETDAR